MRLTQSREVALPLLLVLTGTLLMMDRLNVIRIAHLTQLWPVILIAIGLQELYRWTLSGRNAGRKE